MQRTFKHSLIAAALALSFGSAMAQEALAPTDPPLPEIVVDTGPVITNTADAPPIPAESGGTGEADGAGRTTNASRSRTSSEANGTSSSTVAMEWTGGGQLDAEASANSSTTQSTTDNVSSNLERSPNRATIESGAGTGASGNIGINMAAGAGNLQGNATAIASSTAQDVFASASTYANQSTMTNFSFNMEDSSNDAILDAALAGASGNIGVNLTAGAGNTQSNQLSMVESSGNKVSRSSVAIDQSASGNASQSASSYESTNSANNARMMTGALAGASGNLGISIAAGVGNAQANAMSVSVVR